MPSILDQLDRYYALKRRADQNGNISVPTTLRHPKANEFFHNMMQHQQSGTANGNDRLARRFSANKTVTQSV